MTLMDKACYERGCICYDSQDQNEFVEVVTKAALEEARAKLEYSIKENWAFVPSPKAVGAWVLYDSAPMKTKFMMYAKPTDEQIKNTEELLGWKWEDV